ncbi:MAG: prolyl oligopeptidase family serine peptidase [Bacteroidales bacterium]|nr:prolyl oligopeptidase family serine peptidase [Bacteroidales bacterium]
MKQNDIYYTDQWFVRELKFEENNQNIDTVSNILTEKEPQDTFFILNYNNTFDVSIFIKYPKSDIAIKKTILMLHGWGRPYDEWCNKTSFCEQALALGYILVIPDLGKTNYILSIYPTTDPKYVIYPTITWIMNNMISKLQNDFDILIPGENNFVAGVSTGARGATLLAYYLPNIFRGAASLSGDFDITKINNDNLYVSYFGDYQTNKNRWKKECIAYNLKKYVVPTYIAHGKKDNTAEYQQSNDMYNALKKNHPDILFSAYFNTEGGHDYSYWNSESAHILEFFDFLVKVK